jgi:hypothetical protein
MSILSICAAAFILPAVIDGQEQVMHDVAYDHVATAFTCQRSLSCIISSFSAAVGGPATFAPALRYPTLRHDDTLGGSAETAKYYCWLRREKNSVHMENRVPWEV